MGTRLRYAGILAIVLSAGMAACGPADKVSHTKPYAVAEPEDGMAGDVLGDPAAPGLPAEVTEETRAENPNEESAAPTPPPPPPPGPVYHLDRSLQINEMQVKGTHNSYHLRPAQKTSAAWEYDMPPLAQQLEQYGVRAFEFDLHWNGSDFTVYHWPTDPGTNCPLLTDCIGSLRTWSEKHPGHMPLFVFLDLKYDAEEDNVFDHLDDLEELIAEGWPREAMFTPEDLPGEPANIQSAVREFGWPAVDSMRGKVIFALLVSDAVGERYANNGAGLAGRRMFVASGNTANSWVAIAVFDEVNKYGQYVEQAARGGLLVRTRSDDLPTMGDGFPERFEKALALGAHIIMTDYPVPYTVPDYDMTIPGGTPARCNVVTARPGCAPWQIENLQAASPPEQPPESPTPATAPVE